MRGRISNKVEFVDLFDVCEKCGSEFVRYDQKKDKLFCFSDKCKNQETGLKTVEVKRKKRGCFSTIKED